MQLLLNAPFFILMDIALQARRNVLLFLRKILDSIWERKKAMNRVEEEWYERDLAAAPPPTPETRGLSPCWLLFRIRYIDKAINGKRPWRLSCNLQRMKLVFLTGPFMLYRGSEQKENNVKWKTINTHWSATTLKPLTGKVKIIVSLQCFAVKPRVLPFMWRGNAHLHIALHDGVPCLHMNGAQSVHPSNSTGFRNIPHTRMHHSTAQTANIPVPDTTGHPWVRAALTTQSEPTQYLYNIQHDNIGEGKMAETEHLEFPLSSVGMSKRILLRWFWLPGFMFDTPALV